MIIGWNNVRLLQKKNQGDQTLIVPHFGHINLCLFAARKTMPGIMHNKSKQAHIIFGRNLLLSHSSI